MGSATALSFGLGSVLGICRRRQARQLSRPLLSIGSLALYAVPGFWLGLVLIVIFAVDLRWLPIGGIETSRRPRPASTAPPISPAISSCRSSALGFIYLALYLRMMRAGMAEAWRQDFVLAARAKGLSAPAHRARPRRPQRAVAAGHHARPAIGADARRQRRHRERLFRARPWPLAQEAVARATRRCCSASSWSAPFWSSSSIFLSTSPTPSSIRASAPARPVREPARRFLRTPEAVAGAIILVRCSPWR